MIQTKTTTINGREWSVTQWSGTKNLDVLHALSSVLGPTLSGGIPTGGNVLSSDFQLGKAIDGLIAGLGSKAQFRELVFMLLANTTVDNVSVARQDGFDSVFAGSAIFDLLPGLKFVLETNFGDFISAAAGIIGQFAATQPVEVPKESKTGSSPG